jgi:hypothetical protein
MKIMKKIHFNKYALGCLMFAMMTLSSCIKSNLDDLDTYTDAEITAFKFEYRYQITLGTGEEMQVKALTTKTSIDNTNNTITCNITVPNASNTGNFTSAVKSKVSLSNIVGIASISTAATIKPLDSAPTLGEISDFSAKSFQYKVIAADGKTTKTWTIIIQSFTN